MVMFINNAHSFINVCIYKMLFVTANSKTIDDLFTSLHPTYTTQHQPDK